MTHAASTRRCSIVGIHAALMTALIVAAIETGSAQDAPALPRVRSHSPRITNAIAEGTDRSPTFSHLIETIGATDGLVYVDEGVCGHGVRACLVLSVTVAGPHRVLRILVETRKAPGCELLEVIGHELQHAVEALRNRHVRSTNQIYHFFDGLAPTDASRFETHAAMQTGFAVGREACSGR
jgi:hypothetical protein